MPYVPKHCCTSPSRRGVWIGCYIPYTSSCLPYPSISYQIEGSIDPCTKYLQQWMIWGRVRFQQLHGYIQNIGIDSSGIAQFLDVLRLGMIFCIMFIILRQIKSKMLTGYKRVRAGRDRKWRPGQRGQPLLSLQNRLHIAVCVFACHSWREIFDEKVTCFSVLASYRYLSQTTLLQTCEMGRESDQYIPRYSCTTNSSTSTELASFFSLPM